jgi:urease accessory protein UreE
MPTTITMNETQRRMLVEMQRHTELPDRFNDRMDILLKVPHPTAEEVKAATDELWQLAKDAQPLLTRLAFLAGNRHMARLVTETGLAIAELEHTAG